MIVSFYVYIGRTCSYSMLEVKMHKNRVILFSFSFNVSNHRVVTALLFPFLYASNERNRFDWTEEVGEHNMFDAPITLITFGFYFPLSFMFISITLDCASIIKWLLFPFFINTQYRYHHVIATLYLHWLCFNNARAIIMMTIIIITTRQYKVTS